MSDDAKTPREPSDQVLLSRRLIIFYLALPFAVFKTSSSPLALSSGITSVSENIWLVFLNVVNCILIPYT